MNFTEIDDLNLNNLHSSECGVLFIIYTRFLNFYIFVKTKKLIKYYFSFFNNLLYFIKLFNNI